MRKFRTYFWSEVEPWNSIRSWLLPQILRVLHAFLMVTLRISTTGTTRGMARLNKPGMMGTMLVTWHDLTFVPLHLFRDQNIGVMMSTSHSGQIQASFWRMHGWPTTWGSTNKREGIKALREVLRLLRAGQTFAFTPDGPKGPRHRSHGGAIYLSSKAPAILWPVGIAASSSWRLPTWDKYLIPKPFSRVHLHFGAPFQVPPNISREESKLWQERLTEALDAASERAQYHLDKN